MAKQFNILAKLVDSDDSVVPIMGNGLIGDNSQFPLNEV